jgi:serine phosphatase RsbU (regulator of sigma subunit)
LGVIQLDTLDRHKKFTQEDLQLLVAVANQASMAMDNATLHEERLARERQAREIQFAKDVQRVLLPSQLPSIPGYDFYAYYKAAHQVGGDFYSFVPLQPPLIAIGLGDVAGKGVPAALLMARLTADVRSCVLSEGDPSPAVALLNELLFQSDFGDRFVTFILGFLDYENHVLTLVNAGHLPPFVHRHHGGVDEVAGAEHVGLPLGIAHPSDYSPVQVKLEPGDIVYFFTDGIPDATSPTKERFGMPKLKSTVESSPNEASAAGKQLIKAVETHSLGEPYQFDDTTLVCFGRSK